MTINEPAADALDYLVQALGRYRVDEVEWAAQLREALPLSVDRQSLVTRWAHWLLSDQASPFRWAQDDKRGLHERVLDLYDQRLNGDDPHADDWDTTSDLVHDALSDLYVRGLAGGINSNADYALFWLTRDRKVEAIGYVPLYVAKVWRELNGDGQGSALVLMGDALLRIVREAQA